jgi:membrane-bound metal-dependent hydrolase YbcI (DUF457 family)
VEARTHYAFGALITAAVAPPVSRAVGLDLSPIALAAGVAIGTLGGVLPDIDTPRSLVTHGLLPASGRRETIVVAIGQLLSIPPRLVGLFARSVFEHRGATHSLAFTAIWALMAAPLYAAGGCGLVIGASYLIDLIAKLTHANPIGFDPTPVVSWIVAHTPEVMPLVILCIACGYLSHLLADGITRAPIRLWWPSHRRVWLFPKPLRIRTGGMTERDLLLPLVVLAAVAVIVLQIGVPLRNELVAHQRRAECAHLVAGDHRGACGDAREARPRRRARRARSASGR